MFQCTCAWNFIKKTLAQLFSCEFCEIFKNSYLIEHLAVSELTLLFVNSWTKKFEIYLKRLHFVIKWLTVVIKVQICSARTLGDFQWFEDKMGGKDMKRQVKTLMLVSIFACGDKVYHRGGCNKLFFCPFNGSFVRRPKRPCKLNIELDTRNIFRTLSTYMMELF